MLSGFLTVNSWGLLSIKKELDPTKAKAIQDIEPLKSYKQLKSFMWRVSYVCRFVVALVELLELFYKLLKKDVSFRWGKEQQTAF